jgi:hypothetical protein
MRGESSALSLGSTVMSVQPHRVVRIIVRSKQRCLWLGPRIAAAEVLRRVSSFSEHSERVSDFTTIAIDLPTGCPVGHSDL